MATKLTRLRSTTSSSDEPILQRIFDALTVGSAYFRTGGAKRVLRARREEPLDYRSGIETLHGGVLAINCHARPVRLTEEVHLE